MKTMKSWHWSTLEYAEGHCLTDMNVAQGYPNFLDESIPFLEDMGYLIGNWYGSIDYAPGKIWSVTTEGRKALKAYRLQLLINSTDQCPNGQCKGEYGSECYLRTDCVTCGRPIIRAA
jgi:hypothetical protein